MQCMAEMDDTCPQTVNNRSLFIYYSLAERTIYLKGLQFPQFPSVVSQWSENWVASASKGLCCSITHHATFSWYSCWGQRAWWTTESSPVGLYVNYRGVDHEGRMMELVNAGVHRVVYRSKKQCRGEMDATWPQTMNHLSPLTRYARFSWSRYTCLYPLQKLMPLLNFHPVSLLLSQPRRVLRGIVSIGLHVGLYVCLYSKFPNLFQAMLLVLMLSVWTFPRSQPWSG